MPGRTSDQPQVTHTGADDTHADTTTQAPGRVLRRIQPYLDRAGLDIQSASRLSAYPLWLRPLRG
jgi:hypothetical protein